MTSKVNHDYNITKTIWKNKLVMLVTILFESCDQKHKTQKRGEKERAIIKLTAKVYKR